MQKELTKPQQPSPEEYPYSTQSIDDALESYEKIDPMHLHIEMRSETIPVLIDDTKGPDDPDNIETKKLYFGVIIAEKPAGPVQIAESRHIECLTMKDAIREAGRPLPVMAILAGDGSFVYPYYDESKGKIIAEARARRERRRAKALNHLNLLAALGRGL